MSETAPSTQEEVVCPEQPQTRRRTRWRSCVRDSPRYTGGPGVGRVTGTAPSTQKDQVEVVCQGHPPVHRRTKCRSCVRDSPRYTGGPGVSRVAGTAPSTQKDQVEVVCQGLPPTHRRRQPPAHRRIRWRSYVRNSPQHTGGPGGGRVSGTAPDTQEDQVEVVCQGQPPAHRRTRWR